MRQQAERELLDARRLFEIHVVVLGEPPDRLVADVLVPDAADQFMEQPLAQRAVRNAHPLDA